jgi:hypothetical protein
MRCRRCAGIAAFGAALVSTRAIASKSNIAFCAPPIAVFRLSALRPASERTKSARRMSESFTMRRRMSPASFCAFASCATRHAWANSAPGIAASQSITSPSTLSAARARLRLFCRFSSPRVAMRPSAFSQSEASEPRAPSATSERIARSSRMTCRLTRSPSSP